MRNNGRFGFARVWAVVLATAAMLLIPTGAAYAQDDMQKLAERADNAAAVLSEILGAPDKEIPTWLLERAHCVAVIPKVVKAGFIVGGRHGEGLLSCQTENGWSRPSYVSLTGGSFGLQIGAQATDFVLVFATESAVQHLFKDKFTIGGDASVSAGPVGRTAEAGTDIQLDHEIYSYSRSQGVFAGVSIEGAEFSIDEDANEMMYEGAVTARDLLTSPGASAPEVMTEFLAALRTHVPPRHAGEAR